MDQPTLWGGVNPEETGGAYRKDGPEQSLTAARSTKSGSWHAWIIEHLLSVYPEGLTARNVAQNSDMSGKGQLSPEKAATRLKELHERDLVEYQMDDVTLRPVQAPTTEGNTGSLHKLTRAGYNEALSKHAERITGVRQ